MKIRQILPGDSITTNKHIYSCHSRIDNFTLMIGKPKTPPTYTIFEVWKLKTTHKHPKDKNTHYSHIECQPGSNDWGQVVWSYDTLEDAQFNLTRKSQQAKQPITVILKPKP